jgi:hypothetical protein
MSFKKCKHEWRDYAQVDPMLKGVDECRKCGTLERRSEHPETKPRDLSQTVVGRLYRG